MENCNSITKDQRQHILYSIKKVALSFSQGSEITKFTFTLTLFLAKHELHRTVKKPEMKLVHA